MIIHMSQLLSTGRPISSFSYFYLILFITSKLTEAELSPAFLDNCL